MAPPKCQTNAQVHLKLADSIWRQHNRTCPQQPSPPRPAHHATRTSLPPTSPRHVIRDHCHLTGESKRSSNLGHNHFARKGLKFLGPHCHIICALSLIHFNTLLLIQLLEVRQIPSSSTLQGSNNTAFILKLYFI